MDQLETLIHSKDMKYKERWAPTPLKSFEDAISKGVVVDMPLEIRKNIAYSLQYLQYLELQIKELHLHNVVEKMIYKTYIVTSVSVIEAIFIQVVKHHHVWNEEQWENIQKVETSEYKLEGIKYKIESTIYRKREKTVEAMMPFDVVLKKVKDRKLLDMGHKKLYALNRFRKLRNKVHLQIFEEGETNWHNFGKEEYLTIKYLLWCVLTDDKLDNVTNQGTVDFLKLVEEEELIVSNLETAG